MDECKIPDVCRANFRCENVPYSYSCKCDGGFKLTGPRKDICEGNCGVSRIPVMKMRQETQPQIPIYKYTNT